MLVRRTRPGWKDVTLLDPPPCRDVRVRVVYEGYPAPRQCTAWRLRDDPDTWYDSRTLERIDGHVVAFLTQIFAYLDIS